MKEIELAPGQPAVPQRLPALNALELQAVAELHHRRRRGYNGGVKILQFPAYVFDLLDRYGKPDHSKIGPFMVSQELVALQAYDVIVNKRPLQAAIVILIGVLSFASASLMRKFLDKSKVDVQSATVIEDKRETKSIYMEFVGGVPAVSNPAVAGAAPYSEGV